MKISHSKDVLIKNCTVENVAVAVFCRFTRDVFMLEQINMDQRNIISCHADAAGKIM